MRLFFGLALAHSLFLTPAHAVSVQTCRSALGFFTGVRSGDGTYLNDADRAQLQKILANVHEPAPRRAQVVALWRRARLRALSLPNRLIVANRLKAPRPERNAYGFRADQLLEEISDHPSLVHSIFGIIDDAHDIESDIQMSVVLKHITAGAPLRLADVDPKHREAVMRIEWEIINEFPEALLAQVRAEVAALNLGPEKAEYVNDLLEAKGLWIEQYVDTSNRARHVFAGHGVLADPARVFQNPETIVPPR